MARNAEGEVVGDVFAFERSRLNDYADWFEAFDGALTGKAGVITQLTINADIWKQRGLLLPALREIADR